jgi:hypothetical protein
VLENDIAPEGLQKCWEAPDKPVSTSFPAKESMRRLPPRGRPGAKPRHSRIVLDTNVIVSALL